MLGDRARINNEMMGMGATFEGYLPLKHACSDRI